MINIYLNYIWIVTTLLSLYFLFAILKKYNNINKLIPFIAGFFICTYMSIVFLMSTYSTTQELYKDNLITIDNLKIIEKKLNDVNFKNKKTLKYNYEIEKINYLNKKENEKVVFFNKMFNYLLKGLPFFILVALTYAAFNIILSNNKKNLDIIKEQVSIIKERYSNLKEENKSELIKDLDILLNDIEIQIKETKNDLNTNKMLFIYRNKILKIKKEIEKK